MGADSLIRSATRQINKKGCDVILINRYDCVYDPVLGDDVCTEDNYPCRGAISNYTIQEAESDNVTVDDLRVMIQLLVEVKKTWRVQYENKLWEVIDVTKTRTENKTVTQALQIRALGV